MAFQHGGRFTYIPSLQSQGQDWKPRSERRGQQTRQPHELAWEEGLPVGGTQQRAVHGTVRTLFFFVFFYSDKIYIA